MMQHTKHQVKLFEMYCFAMFITTLCDVFHITNAILLLLTKLMDLAGFSTELI